MKIICHGTEFLGTFTEGQVIQVELEDRQGNVVSLFFDSVQALEKVAGELTELAAKIHEGAEA